MAVQHIEDITHHASAISDDGGSRPNSPLLTAYSVGTAHTSVEEIETSDRFPSHHELGLAHHNESGSIHEATVATVARPEVIQLRGRSPPSRDDDDDDDDEPVSPLTSVPPNLSMDRTASRRSEHEVGDDGDDEASTEMIQPGRHDAPLSIVARSAHAPRQAAQARARQIMTSYRSPRVGVDDATFRRDRDRRSPADNTPDASDDDDVSFEEGTSVLANVREMEMRGEMSDGEEIAPRAKLLDRTEVRDSLEMIRRAVPASPPVSPKRGSIFRRRNTASSKANSPQHGLPTLRQLSLRTGKEGPEADDQPTAIFSKKPLFGETIGVVAVQSRGWLSSSKRKASRGFSLTSDAAIGVAKKFARKFSRQDSGYKSISAPLDVQVHNATYLAGENEGDDPAASSPATTPADRIKNFPYQCQAKRYDGLPRATPSMSSPHYSPRSDSQSDEIQLIQSSETNRELSSEEHRMAVDELPRLRRVSRLQSRHVRDQVQPTVRRSSTSPNRGRAAHKLIRAERGSTPPMKRHAMEQNAAENQKDVLQQLEKALDRQHCIPRLVEERQRHRFRTLHRELKKSPSAQRDASIALQQQCLATREESERKFSLAHRQSEDRTQSPAIIPRDKTAGRGAEMAAIAGVVGNAMQGAGAPLMM